MSAKLAGFIPTTTGADRESGAAGAAPAVEAVGGVGVGGGSRG